MPQYIFHNIFNCVASTLADGVTVFAVGGHRLGSQVLVGQVRSHKPEHRHIYNIHSLKKMQRAILFNDIQLYTSKENFFSRGNIKGKGKISNQ